MSDIANHASGTTPTSEHGQSVLQSTCDGDSQREFCIQGIKGRGSSTPVHEWKSGQAKPSIVIVAKPAFSGEHFPLHKGYCSG